VNSRRNESPPRRTQAPFTGISSRRAQPTTAATSTTNRPDRERDYRELQANHDRRIATHNSALRQKL